MPPSGIAIIFTCGAFRHPERSEMSDVRSCKGKAVRTESKDLAPRHHFAFLISNFSFKQNFQMESKGEPLHGITLSPNFTHTLSSSDNSAPYPPRRDTP